MFFRLPLVFNEKGDVWGDIPFPLLNPIGVKIFEDVGGDLQPPLFDPIGF